MKSLRRGFFASAVSFALHASLLTLNCFSGAGKDGFEVLNLADSPRQAAMAGTGAAAAPDADGFARNPGVLGLLRSPEASLSQANMPLSVSLQSAAYVHPHASGVWAGRATFLTAGGFAGYDGAGAPTGEVKAQDSVLSLGYGRSLAKGGAGLVLKKVSQSIAGASVSVWAADAGWVHSLGRSPFSVDLAVRNLGGKGTFIDEAASLPRSYDGGLAYRGFRGALTAEASLRDSGGRMAPALGAEGWVQNVIAFRAGYDGSRSLGGGFSLGMGFRFGGWRLDYAFLPQGGDFSPTHRFGLTFRFRAPADVAVEEGKSYSQRGRYAEAVYKFKEALDEDPHSAEAIRGLREASESLEQQLGAK